MFDLAYPLQDVVNINGKDYKLNLAFDTVLRLIDLLADEDFNDVEKIVIALKMLTDETFDMPFDKQEEILYEIFKNFIDVGSSSAPATDIKGNPLPTEVVSGGKKTYDIKQDAKYIYASFMQDYGIDLFEQQGKMHWHKFSALLEGLSEDTKFKKVIEIRTMELPSGKGSGKQREQIKKAKRQYELK